LLHVVVVLWTNQASLLGTQDQVQCGSTNRQRDTPPSSYQNPLQQPSSLQQQLKARLCEEYGSLNVFLKICAPPKVPRIIWK
jgi:hypothetical protein